MQDLIIDKTTLKVQSNESQYNLMRRALIKFAQLADFPPSEQILFADTFVPKTMNTPSFKLDWSKGDPSSDGISTVKPNEFNDVRGKNIEFILLPKQKGYLKKRRIELIKERQIQPNILKDKVSLYGFSDNGGYKFWHDRAINTSGKSDNSEIQNVEIPEKLRTSLRLLETEIVNFATRSINDARVRQDYLRQAHEVSEEVLETFMRGKFNEQDAATFANRLRNEIMQAARLRTSDIGLAKAQKMKPYPNALSYYENKYAQEFFDKPFSKLNNSAQRNKVWLRVVKGAGEPNVTATAKITRLSRLGKGLVIVSLAISVYNIATAENKVRATAKESTTLLGGIAGGAAGGAIAGLACGPGAPVCVTIGVFVGGILGALATDVAFDAAL